MSLIRNRHDLYFVIIAVQFIVIFLLLFVLSTGHDFRKDFNILKKEIKTKEDIIWELNRQIRISHHKIDEMQKMKTHYEITLDSLEKVKSKIQVVYKDRIVGLQTFTSEDIREYFANRLSE